MVLTDVDAHPEGTSDGDPRVECCGPTMPELHPTDPCAGHATRLGDVRLSKAEPLASLTDREPEMRRSTGFPSLTHERGSSTTALISDLSADDPALSGDGQVAGGQPGGIPSAHMHEAQIRTN